MNFFMVMVVDRCSTAGSSLWKLRVRGARNRGAKAAKSLQVAGRAVRAVKVQRKKFV
jgi:hypothetical protein